MPYGDRKKKGRLHADDWRRWPRDVKERLYQQYLAEEAVERSRELESRGWQAWYTEIFGESFTYNLAPHHCEAIEWHWSAITQKRAGLQVQKSTYPAIWSRGHRKSNIVRAMVVADACLLSPGYCLYVSCTKAKVRNHAISIESLITSAKVTEYYPAVGQVRRNIQNASKGWTAEFIYSDVGYVFHYIGLDQGVAGANVDDVRPTFIVLDDVDDREDSALISENRLHVLTRSVLPTRQRDTLVFIAQNYISRHGAVYRIHTGKERVLTNRVDTKPIPAVTNLVTEPRTIDGVVHDVITAGQPTWDWYDLTRAQEEIDAIGLNSFIAECQHDVDVDKSGAVLPEYDETVHLVEWQDFNLALDLPPHNRDCPSHWRRYVGHDWGASEGHACVVVVLAVAAQNSPYAGTVFLEKVFSFPVGALAGTVAHTLLEWVLRDNQRHMARFIDLSLLDRATGDPGDLLAAGARKRVQEELAKLDCYSMWHMGHDHKAVRDIYRMIYGLPFQPCNPKRAGGIEQIRHHLRTDMQLEHPFTPNAYGHARLYFLGEKGLDNRWLNNDDGLKIVRTQLPEWRWRPTQLTANGLLDERPMKVDDDVGNAMMMIFTHFQMMSAPLTYAEKLTAAIPTELRYETLLAESPFERGLTPEQEMAHFLALREARKKVRPNVRRFDDYGPVN